MDGDAARARELLRRQASIGQVAGPTISRSGSLIGGVGVLGIGEAWPSQAGRPMAPEGQISIHELSACPAERADGDFSCLYRARGPLGNNAVPTPHPNRRVLS